MRRPLHRLIGPLLGRMRRLAHRLRPGGLARTVRWVSELVAAVCRRRRCSRLSVAVDISPLHERLTGVGWYLQQVLTHLAERDDVRLRLYGPTLVPTPDVAAAVIDLPRGPAVEHVAYEVPDDLAVPPHLLVRLMRRLEPLLIAADGNDVVFAPNYFPPRRFAMARGALVITVHDLAFRHHGWTLWEATVREFERHLGGALFRARRVITVSEAVRAELVAADMASSARIRAIHHGPGQLATVEPGSRPEAIERPYGLFVGTLEPRKNVVTVIEAWRALRADRSDAPGLVLCGRRGWKSDAIRAAVRAAQTDGIVSHLGYVSQETLAALYRDAACVVCPSLYEGFGLPLVEAMLAGAPLVCSDIPVFREVAGEAALYAAPRDPSAWQRAVGDVTGDPELAAELVARGRERVSRFDWEHSARAHLDVFSEAAS